MVLFYLFLYIYINIYIYIYAYFKATIKHIPNNIIRKSKLLYLRLNQDISKSIGSGKTSTNQLVVGKNKDFTWILF